MERDPTSIEFPSEGLTTSAAVTPVGQHLYRLESVPLLAESASFRDVIEADALPEGKLRFKRVVERSGWRAYFVLLTREQLDSAKLSEVLARAEKLGGHCERALGGMLFICVPPDVDWNPAAELAG